MKEKKSTTSSGPTTSLESPKASSRQKSCSRTSIAPSKIVNSDTVEYRVQGGNVKLSEGEFGGKQVSEVMLKFQKYPTKFVKDSNDLQKLIGFYRSLFDNSFGIDKIKYKLKLNYLTNQKDKRDNPPSKKLEKLKKERLEKPEKDRIRAEEDKIKVEEETKNKAKKENEEAWKKLGQIPAWKVVVGILFIIFLISKCNS